MPSHRSIINRLSVFVAERSSRSLSTGIAIVMCVGLLLPALVGSMALTRLNQTRMEIEQARVRQFEAKNTRFSSLSLVFKRVSGRIFENACNGTFIVLYLNNSNC